MNAMPTDLHSLPLDNGHCPGALLQTVANLNSNLNHNHFILGYRHYK